MTQEELADALHDVRRAYRLVYAYQRRITDVIGAIGEVVHRHDIPFIGWSPVHNAPPVKTGKMFFERGKWAWDMLPLYAVHCEWHDPNPRKGFRRRVAVAALADTGFVKEGREPDPSDFEAAASSRSTLTVELWTARGRGVSWRDAVDHAEEHHPGNGVTVTFALENAAYSVERHSLALEELWAPDSLDRLVLAPIRAWTPTPPGIEA